VTQLYGLQPLPVTLVFREVVDMSDNETLIGSVEPEIMGRIAERGEQIARGASRSAALEAGLSIASVPVMIAALARDVGAQATSLSSVLNYALMLEMFENEFYKAVLGMSSSSAQNAAFVAVRGKVNGVRGAMPALRQIQKHEASHIAFLEANGAKNALNLTADSFDFTGGKGSGTGPFAGATTDLVALLLTAQGVEDTGVRAFKGQAANLLAAGNTAVLESALRIHSVEARHASKIRRMRRQSGGPATVRLSGTISGGGSAAAGAGNVPGLPAAVISALESIYANEENTMQAGMNVTTLPNLPSGINVMAAAQEAFDEPLTRAQVTAIVQPFFKVAIPAA
jgi:hypothetical protein